jgi:predicted dehydrogenase
MKNPSIAKNRRSFLKNVGTVAAGSALAPYIFTSATARAQSANDKLGVGSIGTSIYTNRYTGDGDHPGRGAVVGHQAGQLGNMMAVADVNRRNAEFFAKNYDGACEIYTDYKDLLARDDIDVVTIGTPDHWHAKIAIDAMRAGKHVYCEKPLSLTIREGQQVAKVASETRRVFQVGTQQRSEYDQIFLKAVVLARSGRLGDKLHALISVGPGEKGGPFESKPAPQYLDWDFWLGQAPEVPYCPQRCDFDFRWWLAYSGGQVTDWGVHHGDIALWALGMENSGPTKISGKGNFPQIENGFDVAVDFDCNYEFADGHTARLYSGKNELIIGGDRGRIRVNRGGLTGKPVEELSEKDSDWMQEEILKLCNGKQPGNHMKNFFQCVKEGGKPISDVWSHHRSVSLCHLANIAMRLDRSLQWNPEAEKFVSDDEANSMVGRKQREKYQIDVEV